MAEDKDINVEENEFVQNEDQNSTEETKESNTEAPKELTAEEKLAELNDRFLRLYAEFDNYRKRTNKEKVDIITNANAGILADLLPVMDDFDRAILNNQNADDVAIVKEGFQLIFNKFKGILEAKGLYYTDFPNNKKWIDFIHSTYKRFFKRGK